MLPVEYMTRQRQNLASPERSLILQVEEALTTIVRLQPPITMRGFVLLLTVQEHRVTASQLSRRLGFDKSVSSRLINSLERAGYLEPGPRRRARILSISSAGKAWLAPLNRIVRPAEAERDRSDAETLPPK